METIPCSLCGSQQAILKCESHDLLLDQFEAKFSFYQCADCGLIYQNPRPTFAEMSRYYPDDYLPFQVDLSHQSFITQKAIAYGYQSRTKNVTRYKKSGKLLDIGCGSGEFLQQLSDDTRWRLFGLEINPYAANLARDKGLEIVNSTLEDAKFPDNSFDAITMWDVIEHLHDPVQTLREVNRILKPGGILALRFPNGDSWDAKIFKQNWSGFDAPRHLYVFTHKTIHELLNRTGFDVVQMNTRLGSYIGFTLSVDFWMTAKNIRKEKRQAVLKVLQSPLMRIIAAPFFSIYGLTQRATQLMVTAKAR